MIWVFSCACGGEKKAPLFRVRGGSVRSCGCLKREAQKRLVRAGTALVHAHQARKPIAKGDRHGTLVVTNPRSGRHKGGSWMVELTCDCGTVLEVLAHWVRKGSITTCRRQECTYRAERKRAAFLAEDMTDKAFGFLTVVGPGPSVVMKGSGRAVMRWICRCFCGREVLRYRSALKNRAIMSCGCVKGHLYKPGERHHDLLILGYAGEEGRIFYLVRCDCGAELRLLRKDPDHLERSCGCGGLVILHGLAITARQLAEILGSPLHSVLRNLPRTTPDRMILPRKVKKRMARAAARAEP